MSSHAAAHVPPLGPVSDSLLLNGLAYTALALALTVWVRACSARCRPGPARSLAALPALLGCWLAPFIFSAENEYVVYIMVAFSTSWLTAFKVGEVAISFWMGCGVMTVLNDVRVARIFRMRDMRPLFPLTYSSLAGAWHVGP